MLRMKVNLLCHIPIQALDVWKIKSCCCRFCPTGPTKYNQLTEQFLKKMLNTATDNWMENHPG